MFDRKIKWDWRMFPLRSTLQFAASMVLLLLAWALAVRLLKIPSYVLPDPVAVWRALVAGLDDSPLNRSSFWYHLFDTMLATLIGFLIGALIGVAGAAVMAESETVERIAFPYVAALQSLPKVAIAPLYVIWFGYQIDSKIAMAATLGFFPVLLNTLQALSSVEPEKLELASSLNASRWQKFWYIKFPNSLPMVFAGMNLGIVYALLGSLVAEFIGGQRGMGVLILQLQSVNDTAGVFAVLVVLAVVGYLLLSIMRWVQRTVVFWSSNPRDLP
ncbi:MAG TPA: ABC transporter permease [Xanthobacteraceae bacterium]|jgi:NitT/TauT family transport system permease protein|nr:ABC transporter permease [Xanthobacteraceae bacterium]